jgi:hypothetical protein
MSADRKDAVVVVQRGSSEAQPAGNALDKATLDKTAVVLAVAKDIGHIATRLAETRHARVVAKMDIAKIAAETDREVKQAREEIVRIIEQRLSTRERGQIALAGLKEVTEQLRIAHLDDETRRVLLNITRDILMKTLDQPAPPSKP